MSDIVDVFLNQSICGSNLASAVERSFLGWEGNQPPTIEVPDFVAPSFVEAIPTAWARAYVFAEAIRNKQAPYIEELAALVYLLFKRKLVAYAMDNVPLDPQLPAALNGTNPDPEEKEMHLEVLLLAGREDVVVGGYYKPCVLFPAANRGRWTKDDVRPELSDVLEETDIGYPPQRHQIRLCLSPDKIKQVLPSDEDKADFRRFFISVMRHAPDSHVFIACTDWAKENLSASQAEIEESTTQQQALPSAWPSSWKLDQLEEAKVSQCEYPLVKEMPGGKKLYLLLNGLEKWNPDLKKCDIPSLGRGVSLFDVKEVDKKLVITRPGYNGREIALQEGDRVVYLSEYLLKDCNSWTTESQAPLEGRVTVKRIAPESVKESPRNAGYLVPVKLELLTIFGELVDASCFACSGVGSAPGSIRWSFNLHNVFKQLGLPNGGNVYWEAQEVGLTYKLNKVAVAVWPPKSSSEWRYYAAYVVREEQKNTPFVSLVAQNTMRSKTKDLDSAQSRQIVFLDGSDQERGGCYPAALAFSEDPDGRSELGVLYLEWKENTEGVVRKCDLVMDLGTSNTAIAFTFNDQHEPKPLAEFNVKPEAVWGKWDKNDIRNKFDYEFVPWFVGDHKLKKGFFSTALIVPEKLQLQHATKLTCTDLLEVCVPALQQGLMDAVFEDPKATLTARGRKLKKELKWSADGLDELPFYRGLFMGHVLLLAVAELYFYYRAKLTNCAFTFPLAFSKTEEEEYKKQCADILHHIVGKVLKGGEVKVHLIDESTAAAHGVSSDANSLALIVDVGGGTTDIAVMYEDDYEVLESLRVAGRHFFAFTERNVPPSSKGSGWNGPNGNETALKALKRMLGRISGSAVPSDEELARVRIQSSEDLASIGADFSLYYSLMVGKLPPEDAEYREKYAYSTLKEGKGYQTIRGRAFFYHVLLFALLQACGVVIEKKGKIQKINITLGGNAWRLLCLAGKRSDNSGIQESAQMLLGLIKRYVLAKDVLLDKSVLDGVEIGTVVLLGEADKDKGKAEFNSKTRVCLNALSILADEPLRNRAQKILENRNSRPSFTGIDVKTDQGTMPWYARWQGKPDSIQQDSSEEWNTEGSSKGGNTGENLRLPQIAGQAGNTIHRLFLGTVGEGALLKKVAESDWDLLNSDLLKYKYRPKNDRSVPLKWFIERMLYPRTFSDSLIEQKLSEVLK
jgi:hypothetical protein